MKKLALFDLDHTLLSIDSDYAWGVFTTEIGWTDPAVFKQRNDEFYAHYKAGTLDIHDYVRFATDAARLQGAEKSVAAHVDFMRTTVLPNISPQARTLVREHQEAGDMVVIVTATNDFVTRPIAAEFGVEQLLAVELARAPGADGQLGWITGEIHGVPSAREGKVTRVAQWLAARGLDWADLDITFYTDSINDLALMEKVNHPVATNPDDRFARDCDRARMAHTRPVPKINMIKQFIDKLSARKPTAARKKQARKTRGNRPRGTLDQPATGGRTCHRRSDHPATSRF